MTRRLLTMLLLGLLLTAPPGVAEAAAHAELIESSPAENATVPAAPEQVRLTFNEPVTLPENPIEVVGPGNATWQVGRPAIAGAVVTAPVTANGPAGRYTIVYRVVSGDGDAVSGSVQFTLATAAATTTTPTTTTGVTSAPAGTEPTRTEPTRTEPAAGDGGTLLWVWLLAGAVLLAALVFVTLRVRRPGR